MNRITEGTGPRTLALAAGALLVAGMAWASLSPESIGRTGSIELVAAVQVSEPATIDTVTLNAVAGGAGEEVRISSDGILVWTQYRDDRGDLIVELPNTVLADGVGGLESDGLVTGVEIESFPAAERPLTRFIVRTSADTEHSLTLDGTALSLQFVPQTVTAEAAPRSEPSAGGEATGSAENPLPGPAPSGVVATRLQGVELVQLDGAPAIRILGDGEFSFTTFRLEDPPRFVIDLEGVVNTAESATVFADSRFVDQVRMAQFRPYPDPVSRVVLDLREPVLPVLEPSPDGLVVRFGASAQAPAAPSLVAGQPVADPTAEALPRADTDELIEEVAQQLDEPIEQAPTESVSEALFEQEAEEELVDQELAELPAVPEVAGGPEVAGESSQVAGQSPAPEAQEEVVAFQEEPIDEDEVFEEQVAEQRAEEAREAARTEGVEQVLEATEAEAREELQAPSSPAFQQAQVDEFEERDQQEAREQQIEEETLREEEILEQELFEEPEAVVAEVTVEAPAEPSSPPLVAETAQPLAIRDESAEEVPWRPQQPSDVSLYEAQQVAIDSSTTQTSGTRPAFGVREIGEQTQWVGEPISMSLKDSDVTEVLRSIARLADLNIVIQPGVSGPVTVELDRVPWDQALDQILKVNNLGKQLEGNILRIAPVAQLAEEARQQQALEQAKALSVPLATIMRRVSYADADDLARILTRGQRAQTSGGFGGGIGQAQTGILSQRGSVSVDGRTNTLIIRELPTYLNSVIQIIENLDVPEKQVMIEARIVETTRNFSRSLGIDWRFNGVANAARGNTTGLTFPNNVAADGGVALLTGGANGFINLGLGNVLNTFQLDVALNAAEADGLVNVISAPKVAVLNNEQASIQSGLQIPVQTVANNTVTVQFVNATLRLDVTPHVTAEGTIMMNINIQKREPQLAFAVVGATNAPIATREAQTRVIVRDGGTAVIGGIYEVSSNDGSDKVPGLANIPLLGHLFKNRNRSNQNEELLIFITPRVIQL